MGRVREEKRRRKRKSQKKEEPGARKGRKVAKHCVFPMMCGSGGSKSRLAKAAGAEPAGQMSDEKVHAVLARSTFPSQNVQGTKHISKSKCTRHTVFGPLLEVEMSKKCTPLWREAHFEVKMYKICSDHFWKLGCRKSAGRCGAKHISKSKCENKKCVRALLEVELFKNCARLRREAHFEVKSAKNCGVRSAFGRLLDVQMWFHVAGPRDCAPCQQ